MYLNPSPEKADMAALSGQHCVLNRGPRPAPEETVGEVHFNRKREELNMPQQVFLNLLDVTHLTRHGMCKMERNKELD